MKKTLAYFLTETDDTWGFEEIGFNSKAEAKDICCQQCKKNGDSPGCRLHPFLVGLSKTVTIEIIK
jgi:hypothetical protein